MIDLQPYEEIVNGAEWALQIAGLILIGRLAFSPKFRGRTFSREPLARWMVSPYDFTLLLTMAASLAFVGTLALTGLWQTFLPHAANREGIAVIVSGLGIHGFALLAWPALRILLRRLTPELGEHPGLVAFERPRRSSRLRALAGGVGTFAIALPIIFWSSALWGLALHAVGLPEDPQDLIGIFNRTHSPVIMSGMLLVACVLAPVNEEIVFRRSIYRFIRDRLGRRRGIILCGLIFGLVHFNWFSFAPLAIFGALLALAYEVTGDIRVPIIAHGLFNLNTIVGILAGLPQ